MKDERNTLKYMLNSGETAPDVGPGSYQSYISSFKSKPRKTQAKALRAIRQEIASSGRVDITEQITGGFSRYNPGPGQYKPGETIKIGAQFVARESKEAINSQRQTKFDETKYLFKNQGHLQCNVQPMAADKTIRSDPHIPHAIQNPGPATYNSSFFSHNESIAISDFAQSALQKKRPHRKWQQNAIKMNESTTQHQTEYSLA